MKNIQEWLGHSGFTATANFYAHLDTDAKNASAGKMTKVLQIQPDIQPNF